MPNAERRKAALQHLKRVAIGSAFGLAAALLCPLLPDAAQGPCRLVVVLLHALVAQ